MSSFRTGLRFSLASLCLLVTAACLLCALGRPLGVPFILYMVGLSGLPGGPLLAYGARSPRARFLAWILLPVLWFTLWAAAALWWVQAGT